VEQGGTRRVEQDQKWNEPGPSGPPQGIAVKGQSGTSGTREGLLCSRLVPPKRSPKIPKTPYLYINTYIITYYIFIVEQVEQMEQGIL
jgi:hypothetical protein